jgi:pilus assembly protein CpaB
VKRRIIAASVAIVVAVVSGVLLLSYVNSADQRAMAGMRTEKVLVITTAVPKGTDGDQLSDHVALRTLPAKTVVPGALTSTSGLGGKVAITDLEPGEQVLASRFADPAAQQAAGVVHIPKGFSEVSVQLDAQRAAGNNLAAGDHVGVIISLGDSVDNGRTHLAMHQVLVTRVQGVTAQEAASEAKAQTDQKDGTAAQPAPQAGLMVTLAVSAEDVEEVVFAGEYGHIWLSLENKDSNNNGTSIVTEKNDLT